MSSRYLRGALARSGTCWECFFGELAAMEGILFMSLITPRHDRVARRESREDARGGINVRASRPWIERLYRLCARSGGSSNGSLSSSRSLCVLVHLLREVVWASPPLLPMRPGSARASRRHDVRIRSPDPLPSKGRVGGRHGLTHRPSVRWGRCGASSFGLIATSRLRAGARAGFTLETGVLLPCAEPAALSCRRMGCSPRDLDERSHIADISSARRSHIRQARGTPRWLSPNWSTRTPSAGLGPGNDHAMPAMPGVVTRSPTMTVLRPSWPRRPGPP